MMNTGNVKLAFKTALEEAAVIENQVLPINKSALLLTEFANIYHASLISMFD